VILINVEDISSYGSWEYDYYNNGQLNTKSPYSYKNWGSPKSAIEEQFYIAMRWPYQASQNMDSDPMWKKFKKTYFDDKSDSEFFGKVVRL